MTGQTETARIAHAQSEMQELVRTILPSDGNLELADRLGVYRRSSFGEINHGESRLAVCMIAEGSKRVLLGDQVFVYDKDHYFITSMKLPTRSSILMATPEAPYLSVMLTLDPMMVRSVLLSSSHRFEASESPSAFNVATVDADLVNAMTRLLRVSHEQKDAGMLAPLIEQEIVYRLLSGDQGVRLGQIAGLGPTTQGITQALTRMRAEFDQPLTIPDIAQDCGMSVSSFHDHFKRATGLTPLQFQKHLRLREARRLLLSEDIDVANAGFQVGYNDASHFNRDYKKMFGTSPLRDLESLRAAGPLAIAPS